MYKPPETINCKVPKTCPLRNQTIVPQARCIEIVFVPIYVSMHRLNIPGEIELDVLEEYQKTSKIVLENGFNYRDQIIILSEA